MRMGLEVGEGSLSLSRLGSSVRRSESKLDESWLNRSHSRTGHRESAIGRSDSAISTRSAIGRSDSAISTRSDSTIRSSDSGLPSITPRSGRSPRTPKGRSRFVVPQIDFARINGGTNVLVWLFRIIH